MWASRTKLGLSRLLLITMQVKEEGPGNWYEVHGGLCYQGQLRNPAPRGEGKEESRLIDYQATRPSMSR
jgi:hypothetical protein